MSTESNIWTTTMCNIALMGSKALCNISISVPSSDLRNTGYIINNDVGYVLQVYDKSTVLAAEAISDIAVLLDLKVQ